jgi:outer membrane biosynthesis protein TonB
MVRVTRPGLVPLVVASVGVVLVWACATPVGPPSAPIFVAVPPPDAAAPSSAAVSSASTTSSLLPSASDANAGVCAGQCRGTMATPDLGVALQEKANEARRCYNAALAADPGVQGHLVLAVRVGADGSVCSSETLQSELPDDMNACIAALFARAMFPAPTGGCIVAHVPILFKPVHPDAGP